jgi:RNA polymerase sigma-70 factor (ECF subfamily)
MAEPEDLASAVWVEVARNLGTFHGSSEDFRRWLFTIASRRRVDEIRRDQRRRDRDELVRADVGRPAAPGADEIADRSAALDRAIAVVRNLPPEQAEAVLLRVVGDLSVSDVAEIMNRTEGSVRVLVHRGLKHLADDIELAGAPSAPTAPEPVTDRVDRTMYAT